MVVIDRTRRGWWRGRSDFVVYAGPGRGYYFAPGYRWYYAGDRIVLAAIATGIIMESVAGGW